MSIEPRILGIGFLFLLKILSGIWLSRSGKPINAAILTIHKIISLLTVALIATTIHYLRRDVGMSAVEIGAIIITGVLFLLATISGGLLSTGKPTHPAILTVHKVTPFLTVFSSAVTIYLIGWGK